MQKYSRLQVVVMASSILLPYSIVITRNWIFSFNTFLLFPLWSIFLNIEFLSPIAFIPPFLPSFPFLPPAMGLLWFVVGRYVSRSLLQIYSNQRGQIAVGSNTHHPDISNNGEIVWSQQVGAYNYIFSYCKYLLI